MKKIILFLIASYAFFVSGQSIHLSTTYGSQTNPYVGVSAQDASGVWKLYKRALSSFSGGGGSASPGGTTGAIQFKGASGFQGVATGMFYDSANIRFGLLTNAPTHSLTLGSTATGIASYNTVDQTTNYERVRQYWSGNVFNIMSENAGTGILRSFKIGLPTRNITFNQSLSSGNGFYTMDVSTGANGETFLKKGVYNTSSGIVVFNADYQTVQQTSTAGYTVSKTSVYEQSIGSGVRLLIDLGYNTQANGAGTHTSVYSVSSAGEIVSAVLPEYADNTAAKAALGSRNGVWYRTGDVVKQTHP